MDHLEEFKKIHREVISKDLPPLSKEELQRGIREIEALWFFGDNYVVWLN